MFNFLAKSVFYLIASYFIFSISFNNVSLFEHMDHHLRPKMEQVMEHVSWGINLGIERGQRTIKQLFSNSDPESSIYDQ